MNRLSARYRRTRNVRLAAGFRSPSSGSAAAVSELGLEIELKLGGFGGGALHPEVVNSIPTRVRQLDFGRYK